MIRFGVWLCAALLFLSVVAHAEEDKTERVQIKDYDLVSTQKAERNKNKTKTLQQYLQDAEKQQKEGDFDAAAATMEEANKQYESIAGDTLLRWEIIYLHKAANYSKVVFKLYDKQTDDYILLYLLADSYRKNGMFKEAQGIVSRGISLLPAEIEIPKKAPLSITSYKEVPEKYLFLAGVLLFGEQVMIQGDQLSQTKNLEALFDSLEKFWSLVPGVSERKLNDYYGFDLVDVAYYTSLKLYSEDEIKSAKEMVNFYVNNKKATTEREKQQLVEGAKMLTGLSGEIQKK